MTAEERLADLDERFVAIYEATRWRLLGTPIYADRRVVYFEGQDEAGALDLLGTTILDFEASRSIFDDEERLHRDVLADATTRYLDELLGA